MEASSVVVPGHHLQQLQQQDGEALQHGNKLRIVNAMKTSKACEETITTWT